MTGRELILYILSNNLEDELIFDNGKIIGFVTPEEVAARMDVGVATVYAWIHQQKLPSVQIGYAIYIPANYKPPVESNVV